MTTTLPDLRALLTTPLTRIPPEVAARVAAAVAERGTEREPVDVARFGSAV